MAQGRDPSAFRHVQPFAFDTDPIEVRTTLERVGHGGPMRITTGGTPLLLLRQAGNTLRGVPYEVPLDAKGPIVRADDGE